MNKIHLKCDIIDGSIVDTLGQPILLDFISDKSSGEKKICDPETIHFKKNQQICFECYKILFRRRQKGRS